MSASSIPVVSPPPGLSSNFNDSSPFPAASLVLAALWLTLATVFFIGRIYSHTRVTYVLGSDDWACLIAWLFTIAYSILIVYLGPIMRHSWNISMKSYDNDIAIKMFATDLLGTLAMLFPKLSLFLLYRKLFSPNRSTKLLVHIGIVASLATYLAYVPLKTYYCVPRAGQHWNAPEVSQECGKVRSYMIAQGALNLVLDVYSLYIPVPVVWKLQLSTAKKAGVLFVFMHGVMAIVAGILALYYKSRLYQPDRFWNNSFVYLVTIVESNLTVICSCMPAFAPLFKYHFALADFFTSIPAHTQSWTRSDSTSSSFSSSWVFRKFHPKTPSSKPTAAWHDDRKQHQPRPRPSPRTRVGSTTLVAMSTESYGSPPVGENIMMERMEGLDLERGQEIKEPWS